MNTSFPKWHIANRRTVQLVLNALVLFLGSSLGWANPPRMGDSFPSLSGFALEGNVPEIQGKVVLVDFWASWCAPCKKSFPVMKELLDKFGGRGFMIVAVSVDEKKRDMEDFLKKNPVPFRVLRDAKGRLAEATALEKMPTSFLVSAEGKIIAVHNGFDGETTRKEYVSEIDAALKRANK